MSNAATAAPSGAGTLPSAPLRQFRLPEEDEAFLDARGFDWETFIEAPNHWLLVRSVPVPAGYTAAAVDVAIQIVPNYPVAPLDMAYVHPPLTRVDGKPIGGLVFHAIAGRSFQRWSRHRTGANPWRPGVDDISTHFALFEHWLEREFTLR